MSGIEMLNTTSKVPNALSFDNRTTRIDELPFRARYLLGLLLKCLERNEPLTRDLLRESFIEMMAQESPKTWRKQWVGSEYKYVEHDTREFLTNTGWGRSEAMSGSRAWLKYHVGNLVVRGHLIAIPVIDVAPKEDEIKELGRS